MVCAGRQPARPAAPDGTRAYSDHAALHSTGAARCFRRVCARGRTNRQAGAAAAEMKKLLASFARSSAQSRVQLLATTLRPVDGAEMYQPYGPAGSSAFLLPELPRGASPPQLRRDPHLLGCFEFLWTRRVNHTGKAWRTATRAGHLVRLRRLLELLGDHAFPPRPGLLRRRIFRAGMTFCPDR